jgi:hypothetical protein
MAGRTLGNGTGGRDAVTLRTTQKPVLGTDQQYPLCAEPRDAA